MIPIITAEAAVEALLKGSVGVMPTDTVYGLAARAADKAAAARLYALKQREHKPGTIIAASVQQLLELGLNALELQQHGHLWPNPLGIVITAGDDLAYLHQNLDSLVVRVPKHEQFRRMLEVTGPLITSSANLPGHPSATTASEAQRYFGDRVDFYVDGGRVMDGAPSTIIRPSANGIEVLRVGAISEAELVQLLSQA